MEYEEKTDGNEPLKNKRNDKLWEEHFRILENFTQEFGRLPKQTETYQDDKIGRWYANQKKMRKNKDYPRYREEKFEQLEARSKTSYDELWARHFHVFKQFVKEFGRLPKTKEIYRDEKIGIWYDNQKRIYNNADYPENRRSKLKQIEKLCKTPNDELWEQHYRVLEQFVEEFGRLPKSDETYVGDSIGKWYATQKNCSKKENCSEYRRKKLEQIEMSTEIANNGNQGGWKQQLLQPVNEVYDRLPGHNEIHEETISVKEDVNQRKNSTKETCPVEQSAKLEQVSSKHVTHNDEKWEAHYRLLEQFVQEFDRTPTKTDMYHGDNIGEWYANQKQQSKKPGYSENRRRKLEAVRMEIPINDVKWNKNYALLQQFVEEFHRLPKQTEWYHERHLGAWCAMQKQYCKKESYPEKRKQLLREIHLIK